MQVYLKDGTEVGTDVDPMLLAHLVSAWRRSLIVVAIQVVQGERTFFINLMNVNVEKTLQASGQMVVSRSVY